MSYRYDGPLLSGAYHYGNRGLGVLGSEVPSTGTHGAGYLYNDITLPGEASDEFWGEITSFPVGLTSFFAFEDSSFIATGPDGSYPFTYVGRKNGTTYGTVTSSIVIGAGTPVGLALETDTALALAAVQIRPVGLALETDSAFALAAVQHAAVGLAAETDSALPLAPQQVRAVGLATETDTALALAPGVPGGVGMALETDTAFALAGRQILPVGLAAESDTAFALQPVQVGSVQMALEIEVAFALPAVQRALVGLAVETDSAFALNPGSTGGVAGAADVWSYVLGNGLTAGQNVVGIYSMLEALTGQVPRIEKILRNKQITNPAAGTNTIFDDDGVTVLLQGLLYEDAAGAQPYRGQGAERRERLT